MFSTSDALTCNKNDDTDPITEHCKMTKKVNVLKQKRKCKNTKWVGREMRMRKESLKKLNKLF